MTAEAEHTFTLVDPPTISAAGDVVTDVIPILDLEPGDYVLFPEEFEEPGVNLEVAHDYDQPLVLRVADWRPSSDDEHSPAEIVFDCPECDEYAVVVPGEDETIRLIVPGQDHPKWEQP